MWSCVSAGVTHIWNMWIPYLENQITRLSHASLQPIKCRDSQLRLKIAFDGKIVIMWYSFSSKKKNNNNNYKGNEFRDVCTLTLSSMWKGYLKLFSLNCFCHFKRCHQSRTPLGNIMPCRISTTELCGWHCLPIDIVEEKSSTADNDSRKVSLYPVCSKI